MTQVRRGIIVSNACHVTGAPAPGPDDDVLHGSSAAAGRDASAPGPDGAVCAVSAADGDVCPVHPVGAVRPAARQLRPAGCRLLELHKSLASASTAVALLPPGAHVCLLLQHEPERELTSDACLWQPGMVYSQPTMVGSTPSSVTLLNAGGVGSLRSSNSNIIMPTPITSQ